MKKIYFALLTFISISLAAQTQKKPVTTNKPAATLETPAQKTSYGFGVLVAQNLKAQAGDSLDLEAFYRGIRDAYYGQNLQLKQEECQGMVQQHVQSYGRRKTEKMRKAGLDFLEKNKLDPAVKTTSSGLQYKIITSGAETGKMPLATDRVTVHYTGTLIDGTVFDSSVRRGQPATFGLNQVIRGWTEGLQLMREGDKFLFYIPQELGYGANGSGQIPPYSALIFEVELIKVN